MDRIAKWSHGVDDLCVLCKNAPETRNHLFFECSYSSQIWEYQVGRMLGSLYTNRWLEVVELTGMQNGDKNKIRHEEKPMPVIAVQKLIDKRIRNKLSLEN